MAPILTSSDRRYICYKYDGPSLSYKSFVQIRSVSFLPVERLLQVSLITRNVLRGRRWRCFAGGIHDRGRGWVYTDKDRPALVRLPSMLHRPSTTLNLHFYVFQGGVFLLYLWFTAVSVIISTWHHHIIMSWISSSRQ